MLVDRVLRARDGSAGRMRRTDPAAGDRLDALLLNRNVVTHNFNEESFTTEDLVFLYRNVDTEARQLVCNTNDGRRDRNQLVETVVYDDDSDASHASERFSLEDLHDLLLIDEEQFQIFECGRSHENQFCRKFSELGIHLSNLSKSNARKYSFKRPRNKRTFERSRPSPYFCFLRGLNIDKPADCVPEKCFDDNYYNSYMEGVIEFVNNTIEQLKKISDGEYLSPKAKAKWCRVGGKGSDPAMDASKMSTSLLPLRVEGEPQPASRPSKWEESMYSEVDIRAPMKMNEKRVVVEMPRTLHDSARLFEECENTSACESRNRERSSGINSNLDTPLQIERRGFVSFVNFSTAVADPVSMILFIQMENIPENRIFKELQHIMFEEDTPHEFTINNKLLSLPYVEKSTGGKRTKKLPAILYRSPTTNVEEISYGCIASSGSPRTAHREETIGLHSVASFQSTTVGESFKPMKESNIVKDTEKSDHNEFISTHEGNTAYLNVCEDALLSISLLRPKDDRANSQTTANNDTKDDKSNLISSTNIEDATAFAVAAHHSDDPVVLGSTAADEVTQPEHLKKAPSFFEENAGKDNIRQMELKFCDDIINLKFPYDDSIFLSKEKRKNKLESKECRERKKAVTSETSETIKDEFKEVTIPQAARSVTELSSIHKYFRSPVYGSTHSDVERKSEIKTYEILKTGNYPQQFSEGEGTHNKTVDNFFENYKLNLNLDATCSGMTYFKIDKANSVDMRGKKVVSSSSTTSTSVVSGHTSDKLHALPPLTESPRENKINDKDDFNSLMIFIKDFDENDSSNVDCSTMSTNIFHFVHKDTPKEKSKSDLRSRDTKRALPQDCRKSIDKLYDLMKEMVYKGRGETELSSNIDRIPTRETRLSAKRSNRSEYSNKASDAKESKNYNFKVTRGKNNKQKNISVSTAPKSNANTKFSSAQFEIDEKENCPFKERRSNNWNCGNHENAFRAASLAGAPRGPRALDADRQNVKRIYPAARAGGAGAGRSGRYDLTPNKLISVGKDYRSNYTRCSVEQDGRGRPLRCDENEFNSPKKKYLRLSQIENPNIGIGIGKESGVDNFVKRNIADVIDEAKEARGEAVRGPPKQNATRIDALAQPRRPYVRAHCEYYRRRHGRTLVSDRLQRLAAPAHPPASHSSPPRSYAYIAEPIKEPKELNKGNLVKQKRLLTRSSSAESRSPAASPSTEDVRAPALMEKKAVQPSPRQPDVLVKKNCMSTVCPIRMVTATLAIKGQRLSRKDGPKVKFDKLKCAPLQSILSDDSFKSGQNCLIEEPSAVNENIDIDSTSNYDLFKTFGDATEELYATRDEYKDENKVLETKIETESTENDTLSTEPVGLSNVNNNHDIDIDAVTDMSIDQRYLEDKFDVPLDLIQEFRKTVRKPSDQVLFDSEPVIDRTLCDVFQKIVKFNKEPENCSNCMNQIVLVKSENPVYWPKREIESKSFSVLDVLPMILKTHLDFELPDLPVQIANVGYPPSQYSNIECNNKNSYKHRKCNDNMRQISRQITDECVKESHSAEDMICRIRNYRPESSILSFESCPFNCANDNNDSVSNTELNICESYAAFSGKRETDECEKLSTKNYYNGRCQKEVVTNLFLNNNSTFSDRNDNKSSSCTTDETDGDSGNAVNSSDSLDILMGLLNEIKKISKCQAYIATNYECDEEMVDGPHEDSHSTETRNSETKYTHRAMSCALSHDRECSCLSTAKRSEDRNDDVVDGKVFDTKCVSCDITGEMKYNDKGLHVDIGEDGRVSNYTEAPSERSVAGQTETDGADSGRLSASCKPLSDSAYSLKELHLNKMALACPRSVIDLNVSDESYTETIIIYKKVESVVNNYKDLVETTEISKEKLITQIQKNDHDAGKSSYHETIHGRDPFLKFKRDILVTMYSVLVFIVFAALSFSQVVYT